MDMYYLILTNTQRSTVYKADAGTFAPKYLLDEQGKRDCYLMFYLYETVVIDNLWKKMIHMLADPFKIKVFETTITRIMKKDDNHHNFLPWHGRRTVIFPLFECFEHIFCHHCIKKNLQKSSAIQNISITLSLVIIAIIVCNSLYFSTIKLQQFSLIAKFTDTYNS